MSAQDKVKVFVVSYGAGYATPFLPYINGVLVDNPDDADLLWFTGGEDVNPELYGEQPHPRTSFSVQRSYQEDQLLKLFPEKLKVGTCRGHQQFNVADGGKLIQHVNNHAGRSHEVLYMNGEYAFIVNSAHHQMIIPSPNCQPLLYSKGHATVMEDGQGRSLLAEVPKEVEAAWWPTLNAFGIQFHPEWMESTQPAFKWFVAELIRRIQEHK